MTRRTAPIRTGDYTVSRAKPRTYRPRYEVRHPTAEAIAQEIRPLIGLRTRRLVADICEVKGVGKSTAFLAVTMARTARK